MAKEPSVCLWAPRVHPEKGHHDPNLGVCWVGLLKKALLLAALGPGTQWLCRELESRFKGPLHKPESQMHSP